MLKNCMGVLIDPDDTGAFNASILKQLDDKHRENPWPKQNATLRKIQSTKLVKDIFDVYQALFLSS